MKKINSNGYGAKLIGIGLIPLLAVPVILTVINHFLEIQLIRTISWVSFGVGAVIEGVFTCILLIELHQDKVIDRYYTEHADSEKTPQQILDERKNHKLKKMEGHK